MGFYLSQSRLSLRLELNTSVLTTLKMPSSAANRPRAKANRRSLSTDCSVSMTDLFGEARGRLTKMESDILSLFDKLELFDSMLSKLNPLAYILEPTLNTSPNVLNSATNFINSVATEVRKRIDNSRNVIVFNIPDHLQPSFVRSKLLDACNMSHNPCHVTRLKKNSPRHCCPLLFHFPCESIAQEFLKMQVRINNNTQFTRAILAPDRTPLQRLVRKTNATNRNVPKPTPNKDTPPPIPRGSSSAPTPVNNPPNDMRPVDLDASFTSPSQPLAKRPNLKANATLSLVSSTPTQLNSSQRNMIPGTSKTLKSPHGRSVHSTPNKHHSVNRQLPKVIQPKCFNQRNAPCASNTIRPPPLQYLPSSQPTLTYPTTCTSPSLNYYKPQNGSLAFPNHLLPPQIVEPSLPTHTFHLSPMTHTRSTPVATQFYPTAIKPLFPPLSMRPGPSCTLYNTTCPPHPTTYHLAHPSPNLSQLRRPKTDPHKTPTSVLDTPLNLTMPRITANNNRVSHLTHQVPLETAVVMNQHIKLSNRPIPPPSLIPFTPQYLAYPSVHLNTQPYQPINPPYQCKPY